MTKSMTSLPTAIIPTKNACPFSFIPVELLDRVLIWTDPETVSAFSQLARIYHTYVEDNTYLWVSLYTRYFDDLRSDQQRLSMDWKGQVQRRTRALHIANCSSASDEDIERSIDTLLEVVLTAESGTSPSLSIAWLEQFIPPGFICPYEWTGHPLSQARAKLQVLKCERQVGSVSRIASQSYTYDMRHYGRSAGYGPFLPKRRGGSLAINYVHLWHLMNVLFHNIYLSHDDPEDLGLWMSRGFNATRAMTAPPSPIKGDWAGVEGEWTRFVCWMDYSDLESYNWPNGDIPSKDAVLDNTLFADPESSESHAFLQVTMRVVSIDPQPPDSPLRPRIHFEGISIGGGNHESVVKGHVSDEGDGVIRWHLFSVVGNIKRWQTEGTQIGGVQSAAGWIGCWTSPSHAAWEPAGPNWTYKRR